jgi:hypothetical protein
MTRRPRKRKAPRPKQLSRSQLRQLARRQAYLTESRYHVIPERRV